jgi:hypothetical protein
MVSAFRPGRTVSMSKIVVELSKSCVVSRICPETGTHVSMTTRNSISVLFRQELLLPGILSRLQGAASGAVNTGN